MKEEIKTEAQIEVKGQLFNCFLIGGLVAIAPSDENWNNRLFIEIKVLDPNSNTCPVDPLSYLEVDYSKYLEPEFLREAILQAKKMGWQTKEKEGLLRLYFYEGKYFYDSSEEEQKVENKL